MEDLIVPRGPQTQIVQVKTDLVVANLQQIREIEKFHRQHPDMSMNDAGMKWIEQNAFDWRVQKELGKCS